MHGCRTAGVFIASEGGSLTVIRVRRPVAAGRRGGGVRVRYFRREGEALRGDPRLPGNIRRRCVTGRRGATTCPFPEWPPKEGAGKLPVCRFGSAAGKGETDRRTANRKAVLPEPKQLSVRLLRGDRQRTPHTGRLNGTDAERSSVTSDGHQIAGRQSSPYRTAWQNGNRAIIRNLGRSSDCGPAVILGSDSRTEQTRCSDSHRPAGHHPHTGERAEQTPGGSDSANIRRPIPPCQDPDALFPDFMENFPDFYRTFAR